MNNFTQIGNGFYLVRSPEGFNKATKKFIENTNIDNVNIKVVGNALTFPVIVSFTNYHNCIQTSCISSNYLIEMILKSDMELRNKHV